jgi:hemolysin (HlyC) family protein
MNAPGMNDQSRPSLLERLSALLMREPGDRSELTQLLRSAYSRNLLDADALSIIEGALTVSEMAVRDIMVPRAQVDFIDINEPVEKFVKQVIATAHSRFPVIDQNRDDVIGVLLAKDLLRFYAGEEEFNVREMLRPAVFVPEAKRLNVLLREFRASRNHMAIVLDEYGGVAGLVTIEDVLEQIVGDIEDEYDFDEASDNILPEPGGRHRVKAITQIADFNAAFGTRLPEEGADTIGGYLIRHLGRLPKRGESVVIEGLRFQVLRADSRRVYTLLVDKPKS